MPVQGGAAHDGVGVQQSTAPEAPLHSGREEQVDGHRQHAGLCLKLQASSRDLHAISRARGRTSLDREAGRDLVRLGQRLG